MKQKEETNGMVGAEEKGRRREGTTMPNTWLERREESAMGACLVRS
jgi:hypothetical protein